jgi:N-dimethylarginine dimethylaminohydrolase
VTRQARFLMVDPAHFDVSYTINPWMKPDAWAQNPSAWHIRAMRASAQLEQAIVAAGAVVERIPGSAGLPDMVFPANAGVVYKGRATVARFRHTERQGEEAHFLEIFKSLQRRGMLKEVHVLPEGVYQEGAGDCIWDEQRGHFWGAFGPRSTKNSIAALEKFFGEQVVPLELATDTCYHLDVGFCVLEGGDILYYPEALTPQARKTLRVRVPEDRLIEASLDDLRHFSVNAVSLGRNVIMAQTSERLRNLLTARGYRVVEIDLAPFMMSGGGSYCMTLRLDRGLDTTERRLAA